MIQCFDWASNVLSIETNTGIKFRLKLRGNKTIVCGESATGKTLLCNTIEEYKNSFNDKSLSKYDVDNICVLNRHNKNSLIDLRNKLIIIDRADILLERSDIDIINNDTDGNKYIIFSRKPLGIYLSPNYFATLKDENRTVSIEYMFNVRGWN